jgi:hypothetical protein
MDMGISHQELVLRGRANRGWGWLLCALGTVKYD